MVNYRLFLLVVTLLLVSCKKEVDDNTLTACYPPEINEIIIGKCATAGCHNQTSKDAAAGLDLSTWQAMFNGTRNGAVTIPFSPQHSPLFYFINTDSMAGVVQQPTMPVNGVPLSLAEVQKVVAWINSGAPDCNGNIKFSDDPFRAKFYIANSGCDLVGVHDANSRLVMRYIDVGNSALGEELRRIKVSPTGDYWFVSFKNMTEFYKYRTSNDKYAGKVSLGFGNWVDFSISSNGKRAWVVDSSLAGKVAYVDLENMSVLSVYSIPGGLEFPSGCSLNKDNTSLYVCNTNDGLIYKFDLTDPLNPAWTQVVTGSSNGVSSQPFEMTFTPDGTKYLVTCRATNDIRVFSSFNDSLLAVIDVPAGPAQIVSNSAGSKAYASCESGNRVVVIDLNQMTVEDEVFTGYQPYGLALDELRFQLYVVNRNQDASTGIQPHHSSPCGGRNGYLTAINLVNNKLISGLRMELSVDPVSMAVRK